MSPRLIACLVVFAMPGIANAADDPLSCLSSEQKSELMQRVMFARVRPLIEAKLAHTTATIAQAAAKKRLESCESEQSVTPKPDTCASEREALAKAQAAVEAARVQEPLKEYELLAKSMAEIEAIRAEYPDCGTIDR